MRNKQLIAGIGIALATLGCAQAATSTVKIVAFNDFHGNLQSPGNFGVQAGGSGTAIVSKPAGGVDMLAAYVDALKAENPNSVVVSAGDLIGASPLISAFFHDEGTIETMNRLGLEFNAVGNHEFDEGKDELLRMQAGGCHPTDSNTCKGAEVGTPVPFEGAKFKFLAANVVNTANGKTVFPAYAIKSFNTAGGKLKVGFIGLTLKETPTIVTPAGVAGLAFKDEAATVNGLVPKLRAQGVEAIVVLLHQGGSQGSAAPNFINDCSAALQDPTTSPVKGIVAQLDNAVDMVISGHTHTGFICQLPNKAGRAIPVTQASSFGRVLTDIDLTINHANGDVVAVDAHNITVDRTDANYAADAEIKGIVDGYAALVAPLAARTIGTITGPATNSANSAGEMAAGDLIADAQWQATSAAAFGGAQFALMNPGGVRNPGFTAAGYPHDVSYGEAFTVQPFGNSLVTLTLTAAQLKDVLEQQFVGGGCLLSDGVTKNNQTSQRILQISNGLHQEWSESAPACAKVRNVSLSVYDAGGNPTATDLIVSDGAVINPSQTYRVTVNNFMATGGDNYSVFTQGGDMLGGAQDIDALIGYLGRYLPPHSAYDPSAATLHAPRTVKLP
ncbi:bifunctional metallophosphatase/5'-nucleotidase [Methylomonas sp. LWB]|uniref:bifunctional metallophosphatase/5'-nucleotidase n=1 Tax=Methylomonas sp. LWB TaxID=1905845 RepID=UPI0008D9B447|nr:bifunctional metallophosphatase/5'-nucleotidase [Methylomonas sp. LWB]OHX34827.1 bifunctional metallophosphatase/5'-nucleotidase [Methylomonas sp. LWB]